MSKRFRDRQVDREKALEREKGRKREEIKQPDREISLMLNQ